MLRPLLLVLTVTLLSGCCRRAAVSPTLATAQVPPAAPMALQAELERLVTTFGAEHAGVAVHDLNEGWTASVNGERPFAQQSVFKTWLSVAVADAVDRGELRWEDRLRVGPEDLVFPYQPIARAVGPNGSEFTVEELVGWSVKVSDNPSTDVLTRRLGGPSAIQAVLERKGVSGIRIALDERGLHALADAVRAETQGLEDAQARVRARLSADPNGATPLETARALAALHRGELLSAKQTRKVLEIHAATETGPNRLKAGVPRGWRVAHKTGTGGEARGLSLGANDVGFITTPEGRTWAVAVFIAGTDRPLVEQERLIADVARALGALAPEIRPSGPLQSQSVWPSSSPAGGTAWAR